MSDSEILEWLDREITRTGIRLVGVPGKRVIAYGYGPRGFRNVRDAVRQAAENAPPTTKIEHRIVPGGQFR